MKPDPAIRFGYLPNGMRYALQRNATPRGEAAFRLHIDAGSMMEREDQLGLAHFMEHMVFNGTTHVPENEFVQRLERLGLGFGSDTNASTNFDETTYSLDLPRTDAETIDTALLLFRETAGEALLDTGSIDRERGVVLSEERLRASPDYRAAKAQYDFLLRDQLVPRRFPIGSVDIIRHAPRERLVEFYNAWYRPENATFVAVGDFDLDELERKVRARFGDWQGRGPAGRTPVLGEVAPRGTDVAVYQEAGASSNILLAWNQPPDTRTDSNAKRRQTWQRNLVLSILDHRLSRLALASNPPFVQAGASHATLFETADQTVIAATYSAGGWRRALEAIEREERRLVEYGVTQPELDQAIRRMRAGLVAAVAGADTRSSFELAQRLVLSVNQDSVVTTPAARLAQFDDVVRGFRTAAATATSRELFRGEGPLVFVSSPTPIAGGKRAVASVFNRSRALAVARPPDPTDKAWAYTNFGQPGRVVERREIADLQTTFVRFANGVRLTVRPSKDERNEILVQVRAGDGELDLSRDRPNIAWAMQSALVEGGLGRMTVEDIDDALAGRRYSLNPDVGEDSFTIDGRTQPKDFTIQMQVLAAYITDPAFRPLGLERARKRTIDAIGRASSQPFGVISLQLPAYLRSGDQRYGTPPIAAIRATRMDDIRRALRPMLEDEIQVVVAGDTTVDEAIAQTAATFGALPARRPPAVDADARRTAFAAPRAVPVRLTHEGRADQGVAYTAWKTDDFYENQDRALATSVLAAIFRLRLTAEVREKEGITYSPQVGSTASAVYQNFGYLNVMIEAPPARLDGFFADVRRIARDFRDQPVTQDELDRAVRPRVAALQRTKQGNSYWITQLGGAQRDPRWLDWIRQSEAGLRRVTPAAVQTVARAYLNDEAAFSVVVVPAATGLPERGGRPVAASDSPAASASRRGTASAHDIPPARE